MTGSYYIFTLYSYICFPHSSVGKESACNAGDQGSIPGLGRSPGEGNGNPLQYSCLENPMDRGDWQATVHSVSRVRHNLATEQKPPKQHIDPRSAEASLKVKVLVTQSCLNLCDPMDCSLPVSSVHGISQARILEWVAIPFSRGSSRPKDRTWVSYVAGTLFTIWATREAPATRP